MFLYCSFIDTFYAEVTVCLKNNCCLINLKNDKSICHNCIVIKRYKIVKTALFVVSVLSIPPNKIILFVYKISLVACFNSEMSNVWKVTATQRISPCEFKYIVNRLKRLIKFKKI